MEPTREKLLVVLLLSAILLITGIGLLPELSITRADLNDNILHFTLTTRVVQAVERGENPLDCWSSEWSFGYPVLRTYQPLAHVLVASVYFLLGKKIALLTVFVWIRFLSLLLLPVSFYVSARLLQLSRATAAAAALLAPLISTNFLYGVEYNSFTWAGSGLFPQAIVTHLFLLSLGFGSRAIRSGRKLVLAGILVGLTFWAHLIYGYMAVVSLCLAAILPDPETPRRQRVARTLWVGATAFLVALYQLSALLLDRNNINHSHWEVAWKWDSFGPGQVLAWLFSGKLLDFGRLPVLTLLAAAGAGLALWRMRRDASPVLTYLAAGAGLWILMFAGRPLWGPLLVLAGVAPDMHLHRVIGGAHVFLLLLAAVGMSAMWTALLRRRHGAAAVAVTLVLLYPMARERAAVLANNGAWGKRNLLAYEAARGPLAAALAKMKERGGRSYAGLASTWGGNFKIGDVPLYGFLSEANIPAVGFLYHAMALTADILPRFNDWNAEEYRLFNIRTLVGPAAPTSAMPAFLTPRERFGDLQLYDGPAAGYFDVVDVPAAVKTTRASFYEINDRWLASDWMLRQSHLLLDWRGDAPSGMGRVSPDDPLPAMNWPGARAGQAMGERQTGETYEADLEAARPGYALFRMTWHANWRAYLDGVKVRTAMLSPGFIGVELAPGRHHLRMRYETEGWRAAMGLGGIVLVVLLAVGERRGYYARVESALARVGGGLSVPALASPGARRRWLTAGGLALLALPVCVPLMTGSVLLGHDAFCYLPRLVEFHENLSHGILLPRWAPDLGSGSGQPLFLFHPPLLYYVSELWHVMGFDFVTAINLACVLAVFAAGAGMFLLGRLYFGAAGGWLAAAAYLYAPYFAVDLYVRSALEEFTALALLPLALYGFGAHASGGRRKHLLLGAAAYAAILYCHFPAGLLFTPLLIAFLALTAWMKRSWRMLAYQAAGLLLGLGLSASAWLPAWMESRYVAIERAYQGYTHYANHMVYLHQLFYSPWGYGYSLPGPNDGMSFALGWSHLLLAAIACIWVARRPGLADRRLVRFFAVAGALLCVLMLEDAIWVWDHVKLLQEVQMPWRLLGPVSVSTAMLAGALGLLLQSTSRWRRPAMVAAMALLIVPNLSHLQPRASHDVDTAFWSPRQLAWRGIETTTSGEMTPIGVRVPPHYETLRGVVTAGDATFGEPDGSPFSWWCDIHAKVATNIRLATAYFPGWQVRIDGELAQAGAAPETGLIAFTAPAGEHRLTVAWTRTGTRMVADGITLLSLAVMVVALRRRRA